jgi:hypothetical protein
MRHIIRFLTVCAVALAASIAHAQLPPGQPAVSMPVWSGPVDVHVNLGAPRQWDRPFFSSSYHPAGPPAFTWQKVDLKPYGVPADALTADVRGLLILTGAIGNMESADLGVIFRKPGDPNISCHSNYYVGQTTFVTNFVGGQVIAGGQRTNMQAHVPLENGEVEWCWTRSTWGPPQTEVYTLYGVSLSVQGYTRPRASQ